MLEDIFEGELADSFIWDTADMLSLPVTGLTTTIGVSRNHNLYFKNGN
jgi:hypothetical protein